MKTQVDKNGQEYVVFSYRITLDKYNQLKELAKKNKRSINSEADVAIEAHLEEFSNPNNA